MTRKSFLWVLGSAAALALATYAFADEYFWKHLNAILEDDIAASGPGWMIAIGLALFGVRALISKSTKSKL